MRARRCWLESIRKVLRFVGHQSVAEFHDAHRVGWHAIIAEHEFGDPEIAATDHAPDRKALPVRLRGAGPLDVTPASDALARLRIVEHGITVVDVMFGLEIV